MFSKLENSLLLNEKKKKLPEANFVESCLEQNKVLQMRTEVVLITLPLTRIAFLCPN